jgi:glycosyltransferase involved in cell wall biosynthesis
MAHVLILNWRDIKNRHAGGAEVFAHQLAKRLARDGFKVTWFTSRDKNLAARERYDGIDIIRKGSWLSVYSYFPFFFFLHLRKKTDIIVDCQNGIPFFSPLFFSKKIICVIHHVHKEVFKKYSPNIFIKYFGIFLESLIPLVYRESKMIAVSKSTKDALIEDLKFKGEINIIHNGINLNEFSKGEKSETPLILYLGRLKKYKKVSDIIKSVSLIQPKIQDLKLIIAGIGEERPGLEELTKNLNLEKYVHFEGYANEDRKKELLRKSWVLVYPSMQEGWGISVIEANASGTITVGSNSPGLKDSIKDGQTGLLYETSNVDDLTKTLSSILTNKTRRTALENNALEWSKQFDWEKSYKQLRAIINSN